MNIHEMGWIYNALSLSIYIYKCIFMYIYICIYIYIHICVFYEVKSTNRSHSYGSWHSKNREQNQQTSSCLASSSRAVHLSPHKKPGRSRADPFFSEQRETSWVSKMPDDNLWSSMIIIDHLQSSDNLIQHCLLGYEIFTKWCDASAQFYHLLGRERLRHLLNLCRDGFLTPATVLRPCGCLWSNDLA